MSRALPALLAAVAVAAAASACGGTSGDLLALEVSGAPASGTRTIVVSGDGRARCGGGELRPIENQLLIDARELERELVTLAEENRSLPGAAGRDYVVRVRDGAVRWSEGAAAKPEVLARLELLALQLGRDVCP